MIILEQLRQPGTILPNYGGNDVKYRCEHWGSEDDNNSNILNNRNYISHGSIIHKEIEYIIVDHKNEVKGTRFMVPVTEFERLGLISKKQTNMKIQFNRKLAEQAYNEGNVSQRKLIRKHCDMFTLETNTEFLLEAHKIACDKWKKILENEYPNLFVIDKIAILSNKFTNNQNGYLDEFCEEAGLPIKSIQIINSVATKPEYRHRGLYIGIGYEVEVNKTESGGTEIILFKK